MDGAPNEPQVVRRPLLAAATAFCIGALFEPEALTGPLVMLAILAVLTVAAARRQRILAALLVPGVFGAAGVVVGGARLPPSETLSRAVDLDAPRPLLIEGRIAEAPRWRADGHRLVVDLAGTSTTPRVALTPVSGRLWLTVSSTAAPCGGPGDTVRAWARVRAYADPAFPGGEGRKARAARRGVTLRGYAARADHCVRLDAGPGGLEAVRGRMQAAIRARLPGPEGGLVRALAIGDRSGLDPETRDAFRRAGLSHVLAVSGLHLAVTCGLLVLLLTAIFRRIERVSLGWGATRAAALVTLPLVPVYTLLVGAAPSAVRAAWMVGALLVAHAFSRIREAWSALAIAVLVMVAHDPTTLSDPGFQLSFAAVAALLRIQPALADLLAPGRRGWPQPVRAPVEALLASVAATIGTLPLVLRHFGLLPIAGLVANVPAAPLAALAVVPLSLLGGLLALVSPTLAGPVLDAAGLAAGGLRAVAVQAAALPGAAVHLPQPTILECCLFYGATIGLSLPGARRGARRFAILSICGLALSLGIGLALPKLSEDVQVTFLPVGQGDAALVSLPGGRHLLVDTGPGGPGADAATRVLIPFLRRARIGRLDAVVLTHPHADHTGSLEALAAAVVVDEVWWTGDAREGPAALRDWVAEIGGRVVGPSTPPMKYGDATVRVLGPRAPAEGYADVNDGSIVLAIEIGSRRVLLTGDAEALAEQELIEAVQDGLRADVLKAGHHGSRSSTSQAFLRSVRPAHVVFPVGKHNRFRFPHPEVLERVRGAGAEVWRTDEDGAVTVWTDGERLEVSGYLRAASEPADH